MINHLNEEVKLFNCHQPYHESDHVLNIAYNAALGGVCHEDIEQQRNDESFLDALGADRIPDPTAAGDFTRRFTEEASRDLMKAINLTRTGLYRHLEKEQGKGKLIYRTIENCSPSVLTFALKRADEKEVVSQNSGFIRK
ncbi:MAG: hypothetical protein P1V20_32310 [Verrucomicrobiales bacterium]|nr:hypothetical protein [Verrucomicrobiales bacterium]